MFKYLYKIFDKLILANLPVNYITIWLRDLRYSNYKPKVNIDMTTVMVVLLKHLGIYNLFTSDNKVCISGGMLRIIYENINDILEYDNNGTYNKKKLNSLLNKVRDIDIFIPDNISYHAVGDYLLKNGYKKLQTGKYYKSDIDDMNIYIDVKYTPSDYINGKLIMHAVDMTIGMSSYNDHGNLVVTTCKAFERSVTEKVICYNKLGIKYLTATLHRCYIDGKERFPQYDKSRLLNYIGLELNRFRDTDTKLDQLDPYFLNKRPSPGCHCKNCKIDESSLSPTPHSPEYHNSLIYHRDS